MQFAIYSDDLERNIAQELKGALQPSTKSHHAAMDASQLPEFLKKLERNEKRLYRRTIIAVELMLLLFTRTNELIQADWKEINRKEAMWAIPGSRMKMKNDHLVPLPK